MEREKRLAWDQAYLLAIREARNLLTKGISLNQECEDLHLELIKLEINALDFFKTCVLPRVQNVECTKKTQTLISKRKRRRQTEQEKAKLDNDKFVSVF